MEASEPALRTAALRVLVDAFETVILGNQGPAWPLDPLAEPLLWRLGPGHLETRVIVAPSLGFDRGRSFCQGGEVTRATAITCTTKASLLRVAPATPAAVSSGAASYVTGHYDDATGTNSAQQGALYEPERGLLADADAPDAALLFERIGARAGGGRSLTAPWAGLVLAATRTPAGAPRVLAEPDFLDVLRSTIGPQDPHLALFFDEIAVLRWGADRDVQATRPETAWDIDAASLSRNLVLPRPLLPTGSAYVVIRLDQATRSAGLALRTYCETGSRYVWSMARLDDRLQIRSRVQVPHRESSPSAEGMLRELDGVHAALVVGTSLGGSPGVPLDPDDTPFAAHSCEVALDRLPGPSAK